MCRGLRISYLGLNYFISAIEQATRAGTEFLFGYLGGGAFPVDLDGNTAPYLFAFRVLPQVIVFSVIRRTALALESATQHCSRIE